MPKTIKTIALLLVLTVGQNLYGQTTFNYKDDFPKILVKTKDSNDNLSYPKLLNRFIANDTTLTDYEVLALLIAFTDNPEYKPYKDVDIEREIYKLNGENKFRESLDNGMKFVKTHPLSVKALFEIAYSYHKLEKEDSAQIFLYRGSRIFKAMYFSGDGKSPETPAFALGPSDGQDFIYKFVRADIGTMGSGRDKNGNFLDILEAKFESGKTMNLYFIIEHATNKMFSPEEIEKMKDSLEKKEKSKK